MICDRCKLDKRITVTIRFWITKIDRNGKENRVEITRCLCRACGGGAEPMEDEPSVAPVADDGDEQAALELGGTA